jgi:glycerol-3-phosphate acyltransferase PlsX
MFHPASQVIGMEHSPSKATKTMPDASIVIATRLLQDKKVDAVVSAGNSGAVMTAALRFLGRIHGVYRPAITTVLPTLNGRCMITDAGANADCKPEYLLQFAIMAKIAAQTILNIQKPTVGLLSIGEEKEKGNHLTKQAYELLQNCKDIHFIGNVEGRDIPKGKSDVVVCDGFVGNVVLKTMEGTADTLTRMLKKEISSSWLAKAGYLLTRPALNRFRKRIDYAEYGGAPLLGVNGACIISHGKSTAKAIKNAVRMAQIVVENKVTDRIYSEIETLAVPQSPIEAVL